MKKIYLLIIPFILTSCSKGQSTNNLIEKETEKWKKELLINGEVGPPCKDDYIKWGEENPDVYFGLPEKINSKVSDFNNDGKDDILLYFHAGDPCNGGNGNGSDFSQLIYSNGEEYLYNKNLSSKIANLVNEEFINKSKTYGANNVLIFINEFDKMISGEYTLWTENDAHCCPSFSGKYKYDLVKRKIEITIAKNINEN